MSPAVFDPELKAVLDGMLLGIPGVRAGRMFGYPAYSVGKKMFACLYENGVGLKLPAERAAALLGSPGITPFQPLGRARMREWVFLGETAVQDFSCHQALFTASIKYVHDD